VLPRIYEQYVKTGKVELIFVDYPLEMHPRAFEAARAAQCAGEQGQFWDYHHQLFGEAFGRLSPEDLVDHAEVLRLDVAAFKECLASDRHSAEIRGDVRLAQTAGLTGTPAFIFARRIPESTKIRVEGIVRGAAPYTDMAGVIEGLLAKP